MKLLYTSVLMVAACASEGTSSETPPMAATDIQFDNATSGLASTNVQDALDDVVAMAQAQEDRASTSVITCRYASANVTLAQMGTRATAIFPHAFTANECGGTLPDDTYVGTLSRMSVCNDIFGAAVMNSGEPDGPGVQLRTWGGCTGPAEIVAIFFKK
jgi:hypothetical protein